MENIFQTCAHSLFGPHVTLAPTSCLGRSQVLWGMLEGKEYTSGALGRWGLGTADLWLLAPEADLLFYYKNNASVWVAGVTAMLGKVAGAPQSSTAASGPLCRLVECGRRAACHCSIFARAGQKPAPAGSEAPDSRRWPWTGRRTCSEARGGHQQQGSWGFPCGSSERGWRAACSALS